MEKQKNFKIRSAKVGCCGGPAPEGVLACCAKDAEAKAIGEEGCGCGEAATHADDDLSACCKEGAKQ